MPRWGPHADDRLYRAAMELIFERGYDEVTVAEIAERAGLTKRSFFRHYADKREVLFAGAADFEHRVATAVREAPGTVTPIDAVVGALIEAGSELTAWGEPVRHRQRIVAGSTELRERALIKNEAVITATAGALCDRGVDDLTATLVAQVGVAVFTTAFQRWTESPEPTSLESIMVEAMQRLRLGVCGD